MNFPSIDIQGFSLSTDLLVKIRSEQAGYQYGKDFNPAFVNVVKKRADELVKAHTRFAKYIGAKRFEAVIPVLPPDILGAYVLIPNPKIN